MISETLECLAVVVPTPSRPLNHAEGFAIDCIASATAIPSNPPPLRHSAGAQASGKAPNV